MFAVCATLVQRAISALRNTAYCSGVLPVSITAGEIRSQFRGDAEAWHRLEAHFGKAPDDATFPVRGVVMFGVAECARARQAATLLTRGDMTALGEAQRANWNMRGRADGREIVVA